MLKKKMKKFFAFAMALVMTMSVMLSCLSVSAFAVTQSEIDALKSQKSQLASQKNSLQSTINSLQGQQNDQIALKNALDEKNAITVKQILNLNEQIELHTQLIEQKTKEVDEAQKVADAQLEKYKVRVRAMEESGRYNYFEVLFGASSIGEFLSLIDDIGDIMRSDKELEDAYRQSVADLKAVKAEYEQAKAEMEDSKTELETLKAQQEKDIAEAASVIASLQGDISSNSSLLSQLSEQEKQLNADIQKKVDELNKQQEANKGNNGSGSTVGTGNLVWPSYCTYITSRQGPRTHPITGEYRNHGGTDIGASYGSAIYAADSGTVVRSADGWNGGWGNYVMIDHGNGMQTLYAHMSSRAVSVGQTVSRGQTIGYVGSTGMSTGAHLHFEMYINGSRIDPQTRYPGVSFTYSASA
ncbi:MAG: peptidoglycan DD-metalloendopeptidase family protein [Clostridiales bacterium]|nr:peptidoglycan DD-metalloendopeptidase family protein [Clostridiales bacterium]MDY4144186.1 peptidoglycan DD-metalloendopeptidase family protein [Oscillospiraceae bacterium]